MTQKHKSKCATCYQPIREVVDIDTPDGLHTSWRHIGPSNPAPWGHHRASLLITTY